MNYIVDFIDTLTLEEVQQYAASKNITIIKHLSTFKNVFIVSADTEPVVDGQLLVVINDDDSTIELLGLDVTLSDSDIETSFEIAEDKNWWKVASINTMDFNEPTYNHVVRGFGSTVYLMDSGIEETHPEFSDSEIVKLHSFTEDFTDTTGHGTALASLISGKTCGLTGATIKVVKIFDAMRPIKQSELLTAFDAIATDFIACDKPLSVVNMSWGFAKNDYINTKIEQLSSIGLFLVAAAGNAGIAIDDITPASIPSVFTIGAYDETLKPCDFSNYTGDDSLVSVTAAPTNHGELDAWAPGSKIWAASLNSTYGFTAGTSEAAAIASGALAYNLSLSVDETGKGPSQFTTYNSMLDTMRNNWKPNKNGNAGAKFSLANISPYVNAALKLDLLDLSDPKYANSFNRIISYKSGVETPFPTRNLFATANSSTYSMITDRASTARLVTNQDVPAYITVDNKGMMTINAPAIAEPYINIPALEFETFHRDGSTGTTFINVFLLREDITKETAPVVLPPDDPVLNLLLYSVCSGSIPPCYAGSCGSFGGCATVSAKSCMCFYSDVRLKTNINLVDNIEDINIYSYNYIWDDVPCIGAMAQELLVSKYKDAVITASNGYLVVDVSKLPKSIQFLYTNVNNR